jgi:hypothetical protein
MGRALRHLKSQRRVQIFGNCRWPNFRLTPLGCGVASSPDRVHSAVPVRVAPVSASLSGPIYGYPERRWQRRRFCFELRGSKHVPKLGSNGCIPYNLCCTLIGCRHSVPVNEARRRSDKGHLCLHRLRPSLSGGASSFCAPVLIHSLRRWRRHVHALSALGMSTTSVSNSVFIRASIIGRSGNFSDGLYHGRLSVIPPSTA